MHKMSKSFNYCFKKVFFCLSVFLFFSFFSAISLNAMIRDISLDELVRRSDTIVVVEVLAVKTVGTLPSGAQVVANLVSVNQPLKGGVAIGERLKLKTRTIEDEAFLKKGQKTLLFLRKVQNYYEVVSGIAGTWPIEDDGNLYGYGTGKKLSDVEKAIESVEAEMKANPDKKPDSGSRSKIVISL